MLGVMALNPWTSPPTIDHAPVQEGAWSSEGLLRLGDCSDRMSSSSESDEISGSSSWPSLSQAKPAGWPSHEILTWEAAKGRMVFSSRNQTCQGLRHSKCSGPFSSTFSSRLLPWTASSAMLWICQRTRTWELTRCAPANSCRRTPATPRD